MVEASTEFSITQSTLGTSLAQAHESRDAYPSDLQSDEQPARGDSTVMKTMHTLGTRDTREKKKLRDWRRLASN